MGLGAQQELQQRQALVEPRLVGQACAGEQQRLGDRGVAIAQPGFRPRPAAMSGRGMPIAATASRSSARAAGIVGSASSSSSPAPSAANAIARRCGERRAAATRKPSSARARMPGGGSDRGRDTEPPHRPSPPVADGRARRSSCRRCPSGCGSCRRAEGGEDEARDSAGQAVHRRAGRASRQVTTSAARGVVDAVAVFGAGLGEQRMLEQARARR